VDTIPRLEPPIDQPIPVVVVRTLISTRDAASFQLISDTTFKYHSKGVNMNCIGLKLFGLMVLALSAAICSGCRASPPFTAEAAEQSGEQYAEQVRKADSTGVAITFLEHERSGLLLDLARNHKNLKLRFGGKSVTQENLPQSANENERKLQVLSEEMKRRGFVIVAGEYNLQTSVAKEGDKFSTCPPPQEALGPVTIVQDGAMIEFRDAAGKLSGFGVIVESSIAVVPGARDQISPLYLIGAFVGDRTALVLYDTSPMALNPSARPLVCQIGLLSKVESSH
jgi:hypothetical protein